MNPHARAGYRYARGDVSITITITKIDYEHEHEHDRARRIRVYLTTRKSALKGRTINNRTIDNATIGDGMNEERWIVMVLRVPWDPLRFPPSY